MLHHGYIFNHKHKNPFSVLLKPRSLNIECEAIIDIICIFFHHSGLKYSKYCKALLSYVGKMLFVTKHVQQHKKPL